MSNPFGCICRSAHTFCKDPECKCTLHKIGPQEIQSEEPISLPFSKHREPEEELSALVDRIALAEEKETDTSQLVLPKDCVEFEKLPYEEKRIVFQKTALYELVLVQQVGNRYYPIRSYFYFYYQQREESRKAKEQIRLLEDLMERIEQIRGKLSYYMKYEDRYHPFISSVHGCDPDVRKRTGNRLNQALIEENLRRYGIMKKCLQHFRNQEPYLDVEDEFQSRIRMFVYYLTTAKQWSVMEGAVCEYLVAANTYTKIKQEFANILRGICGVLLPEEQLKEQVQTYGVRTAEYRSLCFSTRLLKCYVFITKEHKRWRDPVKVPFFGMLGEKSLESLSSGSFEKTISKEDTLFIKRLLEKSEKDGIDALDSLMFGSEEDSITKPKHWYKRVIRICDGVVLHTGEGMRDRRYNI